MSSDLRQHLQAALGSAYQLDDEMAAGGMARVFAATETEFGRQVVVKVLAPELSAGVSLERFKREIRVAAQLRHPNIVPVLTAARSDDLLFYVMPRIDGASLRTLIDAGPLPLERALGYARDVASALAYAHAHNIVHRDIKPENILTDGDRALVTDFGIARAIERAAGLDTVTSTGLSIGTPRYMSPEQAAADRQIDGRSDIYSFACVLYEMLSGDPPFRASTARALIAMHLNERPPTIGTVRPDLPPWVDRLITTGLAKSPADRFETADRLLEALSGPPTTSQPAPAGAPRAANSRRAVALLAAALVAALGITGATIYARGRTPVATADPSHIAVLSFTAPASDTAAATAAGGFTRDLIAALENVPTLSVISPQGVGGLEHARPDSIGRALHVGTIVTGDIERRGDSLEANVQLIEPSTAVQLASTRIRRPVSDFVRLRDSVVASVAAELRQRLGRELRLRQWRSETSSNDAWALRERAEQLLDYEASMRRDPHNLAPQLALFATADSLLAAAASADRHWPDPLVTQSWLRIRLADAFEGDRALAQLDTGLQHAAAALVRQPGNARALAARGQLRYLIVFYGGGSDTASELLGHARADLLAATAADPHLPDAWLALSSVLRLDGDLPGSVDAARRALAVDAYLRSVPASMSKLIYALLYSGRTADARALCRRALAQYSDNPSVNTCELGILGNAGAGEADVRRVWALVADNERTGPWTLVGGVSPIARYWAAAVLARSGAVDSARHVIAATRQRTDAAGSSDDYWSAEGYARLVAADTTGAIAVLRRAVDIKRTSKLLIASVPQFAGLRDDPRLWNAAGRQRP